MRILLVVDQFFSANNGMTISSRRFAQTLSANGHEVRIVSTGKEGETEYLMPEFHLPVFDKLITSQGMMFAGTDRALLERAVAWADIVHFLMPFTLEHNGIMIARRLGKPYTAAFHVQPENITSSIHMGALTPVNTAIYRWFNHYVYKYCDHIHCPSNFIAGELRRHGYRGKLHVISNGIDPDFRYRKIEKPEALRGRFVILSIGRLSIEKRQDVTIKAIARSRHRSEITLLLAGQGPRREHLRSLAERLGIPVDMRFYEKDALLDVIAQSDLYVHAADAEIEAMSCMEAFAGGLVPIIANSKKSATPQFALDERSLFRAGNADDLAAKIDAWIENPEQRLHMEKEYAALGERYKLSECVRSAEAMFAEAIADARTGHLSCDIKNEVEEG